MNAVIIRLDLTSWRSLNDNRYRLDDLAITSDQYVEAVLEVKTTGVLERRADTRCEGWRGGWGRGCRSGTRLGQDGQMDCMPLK